MSEQSKKRIGFTSADQEEIASKFQKISDERGRRSGLGFSKEKNSTDNKEEEDKAAKLKASVKEMMKCTEAVGRIMKSNLHPDEFEKHKLYEAINDEATSSLEAVIHVNDTDAIHDSAIFSTVSKVPADPLNKAPSTVQKKISEGPLPLYKTVKVGDVVKAIYPQDGKYYEAEVVAAMHKGYPSAKYDIKFVGYSEVVCVSWKAFDPVYTSQKKDEEVAVGRVATDAEGSTAKAKSDLDEFGREVRSSVEGTASQLAPVDRTVEVVVKSSSLYVQSDISSVPKLLKRSTTQDCDSLLHPYLRTRPKGAWKTKR